MACTSTIPRKDGPNWPCDGTDLIIVTWASYEGRRVPIVCPRDLLTDVRADPGIAAALGAPEPYTGGDHMHMMIPEDTTYAQRVAAMVALRGGAA